jgi:MFS family permease
MLSKKVLFLIVISQFFCTSVWFGGNGIAADLIFQYKLDQTAIGNLISMVQFGFICGTLVFAFINIADRYSPSTVFFASAICIAVFNAVILIEGIQLQYVFICRFLTGFFLAGVYPVGMKIAADYFNTKLDKALGFLVGALVLGTAFPHLLKNYPDLLDWRQIICITSVLALIGGLIIKIFVPDGPFRKRGTKLNIYSMVRIFKNPKFKTIAFGYFGHMWELYAFWTFVPVMLLNFQKKYQTHQFNISLFAFLIIALGGMACVIGGLLSQKSGTKKVATIALLLSCICCLLSPLILGLNSLFILILFLIFWGQVVIADSPLFSSLIAHNAIPELKGSSLTLVNCIGFSITIVSIQLINFLQSRIDSQYIYMLLAIGPLAGLYFLFSENDIGLEE